MTYKCFKPFDIIVVPFPFTDTSSSKRRPAVVISSDTAFNSDTQHVICAMITTAKQSSWKSDIPISDLDGAGLATDSVIRFKLFTLDAALILRTIGTLAPQDRAVFNASLKRILMP